MLNTLYVRKLFVVHNIPSLEIFFKYIFFSEIEYMQSMRGVNGSVSGVDIYILIFFKFGGLIYTEGARRKRGDTPPSIHEIYFMI